MKIDILCTSPDHPVNAALAPWIVERSGEHDIALLRHSSALRGGDILFLVSCHERIGAEARAHYRNSFVLHASDLPLGRGWSPHVWSILSGARRITLSLLDAADPVDSGAIWAKAQVEIPDHALHDEINARLFEAEVQMLDRALALVAADATPVPQPETGATHWPRRSPKDSEIDPKLTIAEAFDAIRVADPQRYPAFFRLRGHVYIIELRKVGKHDDDRD